MASITIDDLDDVILEGIGARAATNCRSLQSEIATILRQTLSADDRAKSLRLIADELAALTPDGVRQTDSVELLREDRER